MDTQNVLLWKRVQINVNQLQICESMNNETVDKKAITKV